MYLKEIRTYGFKSFADKINIELGKNINGIVGPNGSGKSNVVDAIRWVLGEQSMKSLRGESSNDIIFSGSNSRKPLNSASVTLIFDNEDRHLPIDYNEVSIKRVSYRNGSNDYFINNESCRLKDISELLTDSGVAKESFNIISQGKIDEILSTKPNDRRVIFEEAAGVLKYKKRKEEAIHKLDRTNNNINRVNDIISELSINIEPLRHQSKQAKLYLDTKDKLKDIEISLMVHDIENLNYEYQEAKKNIDKLNLEVIELSNNNSSYDVDLLKEKDKLKEVEINLYNKQNKLIEVTKEIEKCDADIRLLQERSKYSDEVDKINNNIINLRKEELKINNDINIIDNDCELLNKKKSDKETSLKEIINDYKINKDKKDNIDSSINKNDREINNLKYKIDYLENAINNNSTLPNSVKRILSNPKFTGIHNVIGKLIEVDDKYAVAIATALGASSSYLVVDTPDVAKTLVNYLKENNIGRATFFPLNVIKPRFVDNDTYSKISNNINFINTANNLVSYDDKYENIIMNQLGNVIIVNDITSANEISKIINNRYKIVTLDGQVVNVGGSITGGNNSYNNVLKEKYELDNNKRKLNTLYEENKTLESKVNELNKIISSVSDKIILYRNEINEIDNIIKNKETNKLELVENKNKITNELKDLDIINSNLNSQEEKKLLDTLYKYKYNKDNLNKEIELLKIDKDKINTNILEIEESSKKSSSNISKLEKEINSLEIKINRNDVKIDNLLLNLNEEYNLTFDSAKDKYKLDIEVGEAREIVSKLKSEIKSIGEVNLGSIEEFERINTRYEFLNNQKEDLKKAEDTLLEIIKEMDLIMEDKFIETFNQIQKEFKIVFRELFKGGHSELVLTDPDNILETGIDIKAEPPGKKLQSISLLSGGEKTFTAISLLFAILNVRPVPFCVLDEVEAALDDANVDSFGNYLDKYKDKTQFILITHKKKTMEFANVLYGITMQESGVSKLVSVRLEDIKDKK